MAKKIVSNHTEDVVKPSSIEQVPAQATSVPELVTTPVQKPAPVQTTEVKAANQPYQANRVPNFKVTDEGSKFGVIDMNGTLGHIQPDAGQKYRNAAVNQRIAKMYQEEFAPNAKIDMNSPAKVQNFITSTYNANKDRVPEMYQRRGLITAEEQPKPEQPTVETKKDAASVFKESVESGRSFLDMYNEAIQKPKYDKKRANAMKDNANLSVLADIIKLAGEGVTTSNGGTPIARNSDAPVLNASLQRLNEMYKQQVQGYNQGKFQYMLADERDKRSRAAAAVQEARRIAEQEQAQQNWQAGYDRQINNDKVRAEHDNANLDYKKEHDKQYFDNKKDYEGRNLNLKAQSIAIQRTAANSKSADAKGDEKLHTVIINGQPVKVPTFLVNDVSGRAKQDNVDGSTERFPLDNFIANYKRYYNYSNGQFVPKAQQAANPTQQRQPAKPVQQAVKPQYRPNGERSLIQDKKPQPKSIYD